MPAFSLRARRPRGDVRAPRIEQDPDVLAGFLEDAAHFTGGHARGLAVVTTEGEIAALLQSSDAVLPIGAQSSLTGGATPMGEVLLSTSRLNRIVDVTPDSVRAQAGVTLTALDESLRTSGRYFPPSPTFFGAFVGGTVATNASGAATFKYGPTRDWVQALTIVLPSGDVLDIERGATRAHQDGYFDLELAAGTVRLPIPRHQMPRVPKVSAGYYAQPGMDLIDLFIGSEGTLGVITEVTLRVLPERPAFCVTFVTFSERGAALAFVRQLREAAQATWRARDPHGLDVSSIEHMDARCLELLREDGIDRLHGVSAPAGTTIALLVTLELAPSTTPGQAFDEIGVALEPDAPDTALVRFCRALNEAGVFDRAEIAVPGDRSRADHLLAVREAVPAAVNQRVGRAKQTIDRRIEKTAADMIVPFAAFDELLAQYEEGFRRRRLDAAVWGHIADGHVHPNVIPRSMADVESARAAILGFGRDVIRLGGSPLAEHGVGRNAVKQQLLIELYGEDGIEGMRQVKRALDPQWKLAPGVLFARK